MIKFIIRSCLCLFRANLSCGRFNCITIYNTFSERYFTHIILLTIDVRTRKRNSPRPSVPPNHHYSFAPETVLYLCVDRVCTKEDTHMMRPKSAAG